MNNIYICIYIYIVIQSCTIYRAYCTPVYSLLVVFLPSFCLRSGSLGCSSNVYCHDSASEVRICSRLMATNFRRRRLPSLQESFQEVKKRPHETETLQDRSPCRLLQTKTEFRNHKTLQPTSIMRNNYECPIIVIVIVISKLLKRYSKAKRTRAPAYSQALRRIKGGFPKGGQEKLRSEFQSTRRGQSSC